MYYIVIPHTHARSTARWCGGDVIGAFVWTDWDVSPRCGGMDWLWVGVVDLAGKEVCMGRFHLTGRVGSTAIHWAATTRVWGDAKYAEETGTEDCATTTLVFTCLVYSMEPPIRDTQYLTILPPNFNLCVYTTSEQETGHLPWIPTCLLFGGSTVVVVWWLCTLLPTHAPTHTHTHSHTPPHPPTHPHTHSSPPTHTYSWCLVKELAYLSNH